MASGKDNAPFLAGNPATSGSAPKEPFPNRPQKTGSQNEPDGADEDKFPNRPQKMGKPAYNPQSVPDGGTLPFKPAPQPSKPFKLGK